MKLLAGVAVVLAALPALAQTDDSARPPSPGVKWVEGAPKLVELLPADAALKLSPTQPIPAPGDGRFLFGPTGGFDVRQAAGGLVLQPRTDDGSKADPIQLKGSGRQKLGFTYGTGPEILVPIDVDRAAYRIAALLEVTTPDLSLCFVDSNGNGWFDDLDVDRVAVGVAKDAARLKFEIFTGEVTAAGKRWLVSANPRAAGIWPLSAGVSKDYVRHVSEVNALRRYGGIPPVGFAEELIPLCEAHSKYCAKNGLTHYEEKGKPLFSAAGEYAGRHCNVGGCADAKTLIREMLCTLWHRNFYYDANLTSISVGTADGFGSSDVRSYGNYLRAAALAPFRHALDAPLESHIENPDPFPVQQRQGPFISVNFPLGTKAEMKEASIRPRGGESLKFEWTDPAHPPAKAKQRFPDNDSCIVLIPLLALKPETIYEVSILAHVGDKDETYTWSFRTKSAK